MSTATDELITAYLTDLEREAARLPWHARTELLEDVRSHIEVALAELREEARGGEARGSEGVGAGYGADSVGPDGGAAGLSAGDAGLDVSGSAGEAGSASDVVAPSGAAAPADELTQVRAILAALGDPSEIVAAALADYPSQAPALPALAAQPALQGPPYPLGTLDVCAVALLLLGGFLAGIGWFIGAVLLWTSPRWSRLEKLIGTLILPGGIAGGLLTFAAAHSSAYTNCDGLGHCVTSHTGWDPPGWLTATTVALILAAPAATSVYLVNRARLRPGPSASRASLAIIAGVGAAGLLAVTGLLVATNASSAGGGHASPTPADTGGPVPESGYVSPVSSPAQPSSSASAP
ncbi:hypothetical protein ABH935_002841 [Catenulispora sp. GAS73]|uniref:hypothetical protein n=1 Tax=Catenulispora sp. GAS73 TaxID=3156269 RepID=UPI003512AAC6